LGLGHCALKKTLSGSKKAAPKQAAFGIFAPAHGVSQIVAQITTTLVPTLT
jgi:hypothetical protein